MAEAAGMTTRAEGFTLLEVMVSMAILAIAMVTLLSAGNRAALLAGESERMTSAVTLAREEMERLYTGPRPDLGLSEPHEREDYPDWRWRVEAKETPFPGAVEVAVLVYPKGKEHEEENPWITVRAYAPR